MARLKKNILGVPEGKLGPVVFKERNGKPYVATAPSPRTKPYSPAELEHQNKFGFFGKLSIVLQKDKRIRDAWDDSDVKGYSARDKIIHTNFRLIDDSRDLTPLKLMPLKKIFPVEVKEIKYNKEELAVTFEPFEIPFRIKSCPIISMHGIVHYSGIKSVDGIIPGNLFMNALSEPLPFRKGEEHTFLIPWEPQRMDNYCSRQFCLTVIPETKNGTPEACSENVII